VGSRCEFMLNAKTKAITKFAVKRLDNSHYLTDMIGVWSWNVKDAAMWDSSAAAQRRIDLDFPIGHGSNRLNICVIQVA
jgi:hypothetical protein